MKEILLIMIGLSSLNMAQEAPRFTKVNGVVRDSKTIPEWLEWQDDYSDNEGNIKSANWADAIDYCENLSLDGHNDWRLPNQKELLSIVDYDTSNPSINSIFQKTISNYYWSSTTTMQHGTGNALIVCFFGGFALYNDKSNNSNVRCVRQVLEEEK